MNLRSDMYRKRRSKRGPAVIVLALTGGLIAFAGYKLFFDGTRSATATPESSEPTTPIQTQTPKQPLLSSHRPSPPPPSAAQPALATHTPTRSLDIDPHLSSSGMGRKEESRVVMGSNPPPSRESSQPTRPNPPSAPVQPPPTIRTEPSTPGTTAEAPRSPQATAALSLMQKGMNELAANRLVDARMTLTQAVTSGALPVVEAEKTRTTLGEINERLVFSPEVTPSDPFSGAYVVESGDSLERIVRSEKPLVDWRFIQRINGIARPESIRVGQKIKLVKGPFHAEVHKQSFRMDLFLGEGSQRVFVMSLPVGLGEHKSTPLGLFKVRPQSKLVDPSWANPRTGESFSSADPKNPIGEYWIGLQGLDEATSGLAGYGIHGTIEPDSIGREKSMGCVRMLADDIKLVYEMLVEDKSTVRIVNH